MKPPELVALDFGSLFLADFHIVKKKNKTKTKHQILTYEF